MLFFFFFTWFKFKPYFFFEFFLKLKLIFYKKLNFIKNWIFFFFKSRKLINSSKFKFKLKKRKKQIIVEFFKKNKISMYYSCYKILNLSKIFLLSGLKKYIFFSFFLFFFFFTLTSIQIPWGFFFILNFFFFKKIIKIFLKKFFILFFVKFIKRKRRHRRKKRRKKRSLRTLIIKKNLKHRSFLSLYTKKAYLYKSYIYFYSILWRKFRPKFYRRWKKRFFKRRFKYKLFKKIRKFVKWRIFLKKQLIKFSKTSIQLIKLHRTKNIYKNYYFPKLIKRNYNIKLYNIHKKKKYLNFIKFFSMFILQTLEFFLKNKFLIILKFTRNKRLNKALRYQYRKSSKFQRKIGHGFFLREMLFIIWLSFKSKDLLFLVLWIKRTMERIRRRKQKLFLIALRFVLRKSISPYFYYLRCYGYRCVLWGKIGVSGNAKTRNFVCKNKFYSLTTKTYKNVHEFTTINTHTGVLGLSFFLVY